MGWAARLTHDAKIADRLARLRVWSAHLTDAQILAHAPPAVAYALRPHLTPHPDVTLSRPDAD